MIDDFRNMLTPIQTGKILIILDKVTSLSFAELLGKKPQRIYYREALAQPFN
jgi:hypothetical protein